MADDLFHYKKVKHGHGSRMLSQRMMLITRYADDFVVIHEDRTIVEKAKVHIEEWLQSMGLKLKPSKTRLAHTLENMGMNKPGFTFLGFDIRQFRVKNNKLGYKTLIRPSREGIKRHNRVIKDTIRQMRGAPQVAVIHKLNPIVKGWSRYYASGISRKAYEYLDDQMHRKLWKWAKRRHGHKGDRWIKRKYFRRHGRNNWRFMTHDGKFLRLHAEHKIQRHIKVAGTKSPYDGDWPYWTKRLRRTPGISPRVAILLKTQRGKCARCQLRFEADDRLEVHHMDRDRTNNTIENLRLLHRHCHDVMHGKRGMHDKHRETEEPYESKGSSTVLEPSGEG